MGYNGIATAVKPFGVVSGARGSWDPSPAKRGNRGFLDPWSQPHPPTLRLRTYTLSGVRIGFDNKVATEDSNSTVS